MHPVNYKLIDLSYLNQVAGDDDNVRSTLLDLISKELLEIITQLPVLYIKQKWSAIKDNAHRMKTTLAFAGNADMSTANSEIWKILVDMTAPESMEPMIRTLHTTYEGVVSELQTELRLMTGS